MREPYATVADLAEFVGDAVRETPFVDTQVALAGATDLVDGYLAPRFHVPLAVPLPSWAVNVKRAVVAIAARSLFLDPSGKIDLEYEAAMTWLDGGYVEMIRAAKAGG